jgi:predicted lysophospholipase L1 biosynthesis ABC-type transport system permease subunit
MHPRRRHAQRTAPSRTQIAYLLFLLFLLFLLLVFFVGGLLLAIFLAGALLRLLFLLLLFLLLGLSELANHVKDLTHHFLLDHLEHTVLLQRLA